MQWNGLAKVGRLKGFYCLCAEFIKIGYIIVYLGSLIMGSIGQKEGSKVRGERRGVQSDKGVFGDYGSGRLD